MDELFTDSSQTENNDSAIFTDDSQISTDIPNSPPPDENAPDVSKDVPLDTATDGTPDAEYLEAEATEPDAVPPGDAAPAPLPQTIDLEPIVTQIAQLQETATTVQTDIQAQTTHQTDYFRYSFILLVMIFCAVLVHILFSKIQV